LKRGALSPYTGHIRLVSIADEHGSIQTFDLHSEQLPGETLKALTEAELVIHNTAFELKWLGVKLGIIPKRIFCTLTAARLLSPVREANNDLGSAIDRYLGVKLPRKTKARATGDCTACGRSLNKSWTRQSWPGFSALKWDLLPIITRMERTGFAIDADKMRGLLAKAEAEAKNIAAEVRTAFVLPALNLDSPDQLLLPTPRRRRWPRLIPRWQSRFLLTVRRQSRHRPSRRRWKPNAKGRFTLCGLCARPAAHCRRLQSD
jgi:hypothetical protein